MVLGEWSSVSPFRFSPISAIIHRLPLPCLAIVMLKGTKGNQREPSEKEKGGAKWDLSSLSAACSHCLSVSGVFFLKEENLERWWQCACVHIRRQVYRHIVSYNSNCIFSLKLLLYSWFLGVINLLAPRERRRKTALKRGEGKENIFLDATQSVIALQRTDREDSPMRSAL